MDLRFSVMNDCIEGSPKIEFNHNLAMLQYHQVRSCKLKTTTSVLLCTTLGEVVRSTAIVGCAAALWVRGNITSSDKNLSSSLGMLLITVNQLLQNGRISIPLFVSA